MWKIVDLQSWLNVSWEKTGNYYLLVERNAGQYLLNKLSKQHLEIGKIQKVELEGKFYIVLAIYHPSPISPIGHKRNVEIFNTLDSSIEKLLK